MSTDHLPWRTLGAPALAILYVDDEIASLRCFARLYATRFRLLTASSAEGALATVLQRQGEIGLVLADQRMPEHSGTWLLEQIRLLNPRIGRILVSTFARLPDLSSAQQALNSGLISAFVVKPWDPEQLGEICQAALEHSSMPLRPPVTDSSRGRLRA